MCGIATIVSFKKNNYNQQIKMMVSALHHRGPDETGFYFGNYCFLGHARLSIVDLNKGKQPMFSADKQKVISFNGEIYGYQDVKKQLQGYNFQTCSDTEVILALYDKYGHQCLKYLPGMFAFTIWDRKNKKLFCARDRFGEKPLFYAFGKEGELIIASEIKAIIASGLVEPILDREVLAYYLQNLYISPYRTVYKNIFILPAAHYLVYYKNKIKIAKYWQLPKIDSKISLPEAAEKFKFLFERSVKNQLIADVPLGVFLSGGLDSSTIVAIASKYKTGINTFSLGFGPSNFNELPYAQTIADLYKTNHQEIKNISHSYDIASLLIKMQDIFDEPFGDSANIPTFIISQEASKTVKTVLAGEGSDELLGGYDYWYQKLYYWQLLSKLPQGSVQLLYLLLKLFVKINFISFFKLNILFSATQLSIKHRNILRAYYSQKQYFSKAEIKQLGLPADLGGVQEFVLNDANNTLDDVLRTDILDYLAGDILVKTDRSSMANSLEVRSPFLDVDFASFCLSLPYNLKINSRQGKIILREVYSSMWPSIIKNRPKMGFGAPVTYWLKQKKMKDLKNEYLMPRKRKIYNLLSYQEVKKYFEKDNYQTWALLVLAIWLERHRFNIN